LAPARPSTGESYLVTDPLVVMCAANSWTGTARTDRHITNELARYARILWVQPQVSALRARRLTPALVPVTDRVTRLDVTALPAFTRPGVRHTTAPLVRAQIAWALRKLGATPTAVVTFHPLDLLGRWGDGVVNAFYCTDDFLSGADLMNLDVEAVRRS